MARRTKAEAQVTRQNILNAALDIFSEKNYSVVSVVEIAERAGVTKGAVYWHFTSKALLKMVEEFKPDCIINTYGYTISAILIIFRILQEMSTYDDNAYVKMYTVESEIEMEGKWEYSENDQKGLRDEYNDEEMPMPFIIS